MLDKSDFESRMEAMLKAWDLGIRRFQAAAGEDPEKKRIILDLMGAKDEFRHELGAVKRESPLELAWEERIPEVAATGARVEEIFALAEKVFAL